MSRVKFCGITTVEDALAAVSAGANAIGLQFVKRSPRCISINEAIKISEALPPFISVVGVFDGAEEAEVEEYVGVARLDYVQLHGDEPVDFLARSPVRKIRTVGVETERDLKNIGNLSADALLLDAKVNGVCGGTGQVFDWALLDGIQASVPLMLAGGLNASNVVAAIKTTKIRLLDVCTGIEYEPGVKSFEKMKEFVRLVHGTASGI